MSFTLDVRNFVEKAKKNNETVMRQVSFKLFSAIIKGTPVLDGELRMNWQAAGAVPATGLVPGFDKTGSTAIGAMSNFVLNTATWQELTLTNNKDYAPVVEYGLYPGDGPNTVGGFSKQAPSGMVRTNVLRFQNLINEEAAKVR